MPPKLRNMGIQAFNLIDSRLSDMMNRGFFEMWYKNSGTLPPRHNTISKNCSDVYLEDFAACKSSKVQQKDLAIGCILPHRHAFEKCFVDASAETLCKLAGATRTRTCLESSSISTMTQRSTLAI